MQWMFNGFLVDTDRAEVTGPEGRVRLERLPFLVLTHLIENRHRVVSRDDLVDAVWEGRFVSDSTVSTAVKHARKAIGDTGSDQSVIRTIHGRGFRFVAEIENAETATPAEPIPAEPAPPDAPNPTERAGAGQPSLAALRFQYIGSDPGLAGLATAFPSELLASLSRMRWLHVVSRGSSFQFDPETFEPTIVGTKLGVRYLLSGLVEAVGGSLAISVELQATEDGALLWSDRFCVDPQEIQSARQRIVSTIIAVLELELPQYEARHSRRLKPNELDAWSHFHLGLSHIYKFQMHHNQTAADHFHAALELDPGFARAHAGLSFTHWQNAFMRFGADQKGLVEQAAASAERALDLDPSDPFSNFNMGRARWLEGDIGSSQIWLDRALFLNPNSAQCHYNKGLLFALDGTPDAAIDAASKAMSLSPLDPLRYAMLSVQALSRIALEDFDSAGALGDQAMQSPAAHYYISLIAACAKELQGERAAAQRHVQQALHRRPDVTVAMFLTVFPFREAAMRQTVAGALGRLGIP
ncbi:MAG: winged helix-turn-helix domain-containing protein [Pseudomonadota bacterium]